MPSNTQLAREVRRQNCLVLGTFPCDGFQFVQTHFQISHFSPFANLVALRCPPCIMFVAAAMAIAQSAQQGIFNRQSELKTG
jgi:hypothetical protein